MWKNKYNSILRAYIPRKIMSKYTEGMVNVLNIITHYTWNSKYSLWALIQ